MGRHSQSTTGSRTRPRHRKPSPVSDLTQAAATGLGATAMMGTVVTGIASMGGSAEAATANDFYKLRVCESSDNYRANTGNGYYGAYQFDLSTWHANGFSGYPDQASPQTQDQAAQVLYSRRGWQPWPVCSQRMGLVDDRASRSSNRTSLLAHGAVPAFGGQILTTAFVSERRGDVYSWQAQMSRRGWPIAVDGYFGPQSARFAAAFAAEKGVTDGLPGQVGRNVWTAAWTAPIT